MKITNKLALVALCLWSIGVTAYATSVKTTHVTLKHAHSLLPDDSGCDDGDADDGGE